ncbi:MAG: GIY-YIG nuclease family protein [Pacificimonas sp.]|jgi:hypothetical protein|nr:GIY-YIG nuclease family protein [Pacificimonas sp.]
MIFANYGLLWHVARTNWKEGLIGYVNYGDNVDFSYQRGIYVLYDDAFDVMYVGQAGQGNAGLWDRLRAHQYNERAERWTRFSWFGLDHVDPEQGAEPARLVRPDRDQAVTLSVANLLDHIEAVLITATEARLNKQGGRFGDAVKYWQAYDWDKDPIDRLARIEAQVDDIAARLDKSKR